MTKEPKQGDLPVTNPYSSAVLSECGKYRYKLSRTWEPHRPVLVWIMLNPSTADHTKDDPTIRKVTGFSKRNGFGSIEVYNLFAYRATNPAELRRVPDPVGPENMKHLSALSNSSKSVVFAWGTHGRLKFQGHEVACRFMSNPNVFYLGATKNQQPKHPLYVSYSQSLRRWWLRPG